MAKKRGRPKKNTLPIANIDTNVKRRRTRGLGLESILREEAFSHYKKLGSVKAISEIPSMPDYKTLLRWKDEDKWDERISKTQENLQKWEGVLAKIESDSIVKDDVAHLMLLNFIFEKAIRSAIEKDLEPSTWKEFLDTMKMVFEQKRLLMGRAGSKAEFSIDFTSMDETEVRETIKKINEILGAMSTTPHSPEEQVKGLIKRKVELEKVLNDKVEEEEKGEYENLELNKPDGAEIVDIEEVESEEVEPKGIETNEQNFDDFIKELAEGK